MRGPTLSSMLAVGILGARSASAVQAATSVTPVEKVIDLLAKLSDQVAEEGAKEAAQYDKYACFCKNQAAEKAHYIARSNSIIAALDADITLLTTQITDLSADTVRLGTRVTELEGEIDTKTAARQTEHEAYVTADETVKVAIDAVKRAIKALQGSKKLMTSTKLAMPQLEAVARLPEAKGMALLQAIVHQPTGHASEYQSNAIIDSLKTLQTTFLAQKQSQDDAEFEAKDLFDKEVLAERQEMTFKTKEKEQKEAIVAYKTSVKEEKEGEKLSHEAANAADLEFEGELNTTCAAAATQFDQRSQARGSELSALAEAHQILKAGVQTTYEANKKLVGLAGVKARLDLHAAKANKPVSFLQVSDRGAGNANLGAQAAKRALEHVAASAKRLKSTILAALVTKASLQEDHFVKVRSLISDIIARLEQQALDEADQKSFCDGAMAKAIQTRDKQALKKEGEAATILTETVKREQLLKEMEEISKEIAELNKALNEAKELRAQEKAANAQTVADAEAGKSAVEEAITVLKAFYEPSLIQAKQTPADRREKTVGDLAPEGPPQEDYSGNQAASAGILGLMEVIVTDFDRTVTTTEADETAAETSFKTYETSTRTSIDAKKTEKGDKEKESKQAENAVVTAKNKKRTAANLHASAVKELQKLAPMCVDGTETYQERVAKREQEVQSLKEALHILENWQG